MVKAMVNHGKMRENDGKTMVKSIETLEGGAQERARAVDRQHALGHAHGVHGEAVEAHGRGARRVSLGRWGGVFEPFSAVFGRFLRVFEVFWAMPGTRKPFKSTSASVSTPSAGSPSPRPGSIGCTSLECEPRSRFSPVSDEKHGIFMVFSWYFP